MAKFTDNCVCIRKIGGEVSKYTRIDPALQRELQKIVENLISPGKGILAIDETSASLEAKFHQLGLENTDITRRDYREIILSSDQTKLSECLSGVILNHETLYAKTSEDKEFVDILNDKNIIPGIKVDKGTVSLFGTLNEDTTEGLDSLQERCIQYKKDGCHFAKWRCTYKLSDNRPSKLAVMQNASVLARYASIAQSARLVPVLVPEILTIGDHEMPRALEVHEEVLSSLFHALMNHHVFLEGIILGSSMVVAGIQSVQFCKPEMVADFTLTALRRTVPAAVPAIMFLNDSQTDDAAIINLNAINNADGKKPWTLSFCFSSPLHAEATETWGGKQENIAAAQAIFLQKVQRCSEASLGILDTDEFERSIKIPDDCSDME